jgi:hypothetical protein
MASIPTTEPKNSNAVHTSSYEAVNNFSSSKKEDQNQLVQEINKPSYPSSNTGSHLLKNSKLPAGPDQCPSKEQNSYNALDRWVTSNAAEDPWSSLVCKYRKSDELKGEAVDVLGGVENLEDLDVFDLREYGLFDDSPAS